MGQNNHAQDKVEEYLRQLEAREKANRRKRIFYLLPPLILGGILAYGYFFPSKPLSEPRKKLLEVYQASDLSSGKVREIFEVDNSEIVIEHPLFGTDTIHSAAEYEEMVKFTRQAEEDKFAVNSSIEDADSIRVAAKGTLEIYTVDVAGERIVGSPLTFTVENYNPEVTYILDFGNGISRKVEERSTYIYPLKGHFVMQLFASKSGKGASVYTKKYEIKGEEIESDSLGTEMETVSDISQ
ncbi:MAG: hypothetical protein AAF696_06285 [Bacteroidota bacterium]